MFSSIAKDDYVIKTTKIVSFLPLINNTVTIGLNFLLLSISAISSSKTINILKFYFFFCVVFFNIFLNIIHIIWIFNKTLESLLLS